MARKKKMNSLFQEFKAFITRGNIVDMAVGVIIGGAFTAIVTALTSHILQPLINALIAAITGGSDALASARTIIGETIYTADGLVDWNSTIYIDWGTFISAIINFLLVALILFTILKTVNYVTKKKKDLEAKTLEKYYEKHPEERPVPEEPAPAEPTDHDLLKEIVELMKADKEEKK